MDGVGWEELAQARAPEGEGHGLAVAEAWGGARSAGSTEPGCQKLAPAAWGILSPRLVTRETGTLWEQGGCTLSPPRAQDRPLRAPAVGPWAPFTPVPGLKEQWAG